MVARFYYIILVPFSSIAYLKKNYRKRFSHHCTMWAFQIKHYREKVILVITCSYRLIISLPLIPVVENFFCFYFFLLQINKSFFFKAKHITLFIAKGFVIYNIMTTRISYSSKENLSIPLHA